MNRITPLPIRFTYTQLKNWRDVPRETVALIAMACSRGVDFRGSSKSDILTSIIEGRYGCQPDIIEFERRMSEAANIHRKHRNTLNEVLAPLFRNP